MSERTAGELDWSDKSVWLCQGHLKNGVPCKARAVARFTDSDGTVHILCRYHAQQRHQEMEQTGQAVAIDIEITDND